MELEEALKRILDLERECKEKDDMNTSLKIENDSFKDKIQEQETKIVDLKRINMSYFERLTMETKNLNEPAPIVSKTEESPQSWDVFLDNWEK